MRVTFGGITALLLARRVLHEAGWDAPVVAAPPGGSPCGMALALPRRQLPEVLETLRARGLSWAAVRTADGEMVPLPVPIP